MFVMEGASVASRFSVVRAGLVGAHECSFARDSAGAVLVWGRLIVGGSAGFPIRERTPDHSSA